MPELYDPEQVERLIESSDRLDSSIEDLRCELRHVKKIIWILVACVVLAGGAAVRSYTTDQFVKSQRAATVLTTCVQFNVQRQEVRASIKDSLAEALTSTVSPDQQKQLDRLVDAELPYRDCSPNGVSVFYQHPPGDPAAEVPTTTITK